MKKIVTFLLLTNILYIQAQNCWPSSANTDLDINNIRAKLLCGGDMWWDGVNAAAYEYPKIDPSSGQIPKHVLFAGALWLSGIDNNGDLKCAAQTYRNQGHDFWPGPLSLAQNTVSDITCTNFDRFFPILRSELNLHVGAVNNATAPLSIASIASNILEWPAKGNQYLDSAYSMTITEDLAPFEDVNNNGIYDPQNGDYPLMKGDQSIFWVLNDLGNTHARSNGSPLGVEIQCMAYAYITNNELNDATFYDYKIIKKTLGNLDDFYFSQFVDPNIDGPQNDYVGCDTSLNYGFGYATSGAVVITQLINSPSSKGLSAFNYFVNSPGPQLSDPTIDVNFRNIQLGKFIDGSSMTCGGNGTTGTIPTNFAFPGNPANASAYNGSCEAWSEVSAGNIQSDKRYVMSSGPYNLVMSSPLEFTIGVIIAPTDPMTYTGIPDKVSLINPVVEHVDSFVFNINNNPYQVNPISSILDFDDVANNILVYPNPAQDFITIESNNGVKIEKLEIYNIMGQKIKTDIENKNINVSTFSPGIYTLKVYQENTSQIIVKKFVLN